MTPRLAARKSRDKKLNPLFEGDIQPAARALFVGFDGLLHDEIQTNGLVGEGTDMSDPFTKIEFIHIGKCDGLNDPDTASVGDGCD